MPTYDYQCDACGAKMEIFHSIKDPPRTTCPTCGAEALRRLLGTGGGLLFKGSGFYITDYRSDGYRKAASGESSSSSGSESKSGDSGGSSSSGSSGGSGSSGSGSSGSAKSSGSTASSSDS